MKAITGVSVQVNRGAVVSAFLNGNFKRCLLLQICFLHLHVHLTRTHHLARALLSLPPLLVLVLNNSCSSPKPKTVVMTHPQGEGSQQSLFCTSPNVAIFHFSFEDSLFSPLIKKCGE